MGLGGKEGVCHQRVGVSLPNIGLGSRFHHTQHPGMTGQNPLDPGRRAAATAKLKRDLDLQRIVDFQPAESPWLVDAQQACIDQLAHRSVWHPAQFLGLAGSRPDAGHQCTCRLDQVRAFRPHWILLEAGGL